MPNDFVLPSFKGKDLSDEFFFVGRLKEHEIRAETRTNSTTQEEFTSVSLHTVYEQLDREVPAARHSFFRVPQGKISPGVPLGRYITAMESAGTPIDFSGGPTATLEELQASLQGPIDTVYVVVQKTISNRADQNPGRYVFPIAKIGYGQEWDEEEGKRIIAEARSVSASANSGKTVAKAAAGA